MKYKVEVGAVFFVDILGMSALTRGHVDLSGLESNIDLSIYNHGKISGQSVSKNLNQHVATWMLLKFREILGDISDKYGVEISQLSDCAFIWSKKSFQVVLAASDLMWRATLSGILCRGGLAYGEIIIPQPDGRGLGTILSGSAVTNAATLERSGKGCRIFTDNDSAHYLMSSFPKGVNSIYAEKISIDLFQPLLNPLDFSITDEFKWYLYFNLKELTSTPNEINHGEQSMHMAALVSVLRHSPFYAWNVLNKEGRLHISASIDFISSSIVFHTEDEDTKISVEYSSEYIGNVKRGQKQIIGFFQDYSVNALTRKMKAEIGNRIANKIIQEHLKISHKSSHQADDIGL